MEKELICITCPKGCHLKVDAEANKVTGNACPRGAEYGINEVTHPVRVITSTVKVKNGQIPVVPVKTKTPIPKELNFKCMEEINKATILAPINIGDIVITNILGTGVDIVATRNVEKI
jgi:CxxC motif-containing protein